MELKDHKNYWEWELSSRTLTRNVEWECTNRNRTEDFRLGCVCKSPSEEEQNGANFSFIIKE